MVMSFLAVVAVVSIVLDAGVVFLDSKHGQVAYSANLLPTPASTPSAGGSSQWWSLATPTSRRSCRGAPEAAAGFMVGLGAVRGDQPPALTSKPVPATVHRLCRLRQVYNFKLQSSCAISDTFVANPIVCTMDLVGSASMEDTNCAHAHAVPQGFESPGRFNSLLSPVIWAHVSSSFGTWTVIATPRSCNYRCSHATAFVRVEHRPPGSPGMPSVSPRFDECLRVHVCLSPVKLLRYLRLNAFLPQLPNP